MPLISIIVPVYKVEKYIHRCVESILDQTFSDFELILVDDGSPDNCGAICDEYAEKDSRIHVIHQKNGGLSAARNVGIDWAFANSDSQWITFIDSDDWIHPRMLEILLRSAQKESVDISICGYLETSGSMLEEQPELVAKVWSSEELFLEHNTNAIVAWGKLYKRECFQNVRYPVGKLHEDEYTTYKLLFAQEKVVFTDSPLYYYYQNQSGITKSVWTPRRMDSVQALREQTDFFKKNGFKNAYRMVSCEYANTIIRHRENVSVSQLEEAEKKKYLKTLQNQLRRAVWQYRGVYIRQREWGFYVESVRDITTMVRNMLRIAHK